MQSLNIAFPSQRLFFKNQLETHNRVVEGHWKFLQNQILERLKDDKLELAGDGR